MSGKKGFDPFVFLEITSDPIFKKQITTDLLNKIGEYLIIRTSELLPEETINTVNSHKELFEIAFKNIPDFSNKIKMFLEDFKTLYNQN